MLLCQRHSENRDRCCWLLDPMGRPIITRGDGLKGRTPGSRSKKIAKPQRGSRAVNRIQLIATRYSSHAQPVSRCQGMPRRVLQRRRSHQMKIKRPLPVPALASPLSTFVCAEHIHPIETSKNSKTANAIRGATPPVIASRDRTLTRPPPDGKLRLRAECLKPPPSWFAGPRVALADHQRHRARTMIGGSLLACKVGGRQSFSIAALRLS